jgi:hypothetical protein
VVKIPSEFVGGQIVSWRLPPKAAEAASASFHLRAKETAALIFLKAAVKMCRRVKILLLCDGFFSFAVVRQNGQYLLLIDGLLLFLLCFFTRYAV